MQLYFFCYIFCLQVFWCGLCVCTGSHFLAACHISVTCFFCFAYYFSVFDLHLQSYLFQFCCIFFICLRSFVISFVLEPLWLPYSLKHLPGPSLTFNKIKDVYFSPTMPHPFLSNSELVTYHWSSGLYILLCDEWWVWWEDTSLFFSVLFWFHGLLQCFKCSWHWFSVIFFPLLFL